MVAERGTGKCTGSRVPSERVSQIPAGDLEAEVFKVRFAHSVRSVEPIETTYVLECAPRCVRCVGPELDNDIFDADGISHFTQNGGRGDNAVHDIQGVSYQHDTPTRISSHPLSVTASRKVQRPAEDRYYNGKTR